MKRFTVILSFAITILAVAFVTRAQSRPGAADRVTKGEDIAAPVKFSEAISREQAEAILGELRAIRALLERQELRTAGAAPARQTTPPEKVALSLVDEKQWYSQGKEDAPVTIVEFTDYQCPYCRRFDQSTFAELKKNYIEKGMVRFVARDLPLEFHANAQPAAEAARCAGDQGKFWEMRDALFASGGELNREALIRNARSLALNEETFTSCLDTEKHKAEIQADLAESTRLRITGTPAFVIGRSGKGVLEGVKVNGALPLAAFDAAIRQALGADTAALSGRMPSSR